MNSTPSQKLINTKGLGGNSVSMFIYRKPGFEKRSPNQGRSKVNLLRRRGRKSKIPWLSNNFAEKIFYNQFHTLILPYHQAEIQMRYYRCHCECKFGKFTYDSYQPVQHKGGRWIMGAIVERRYTFVIPRVMPVFEIRFSGRIQSSDRLKSFIQKIILWAGIGLTESAYYSVDGQA